MTVQAFLRKTEAYFGKEYGEATDTVERWLTLKVSEKDLPLLYAEVVRTISTRYKVLPGVKELHEAWRDVRSRQTTEHDWRAFACTCFPEKGGTMVHDGPLRKSSYQCGLCGEHVRAEDWTEYPINATWEEIAAKFGVHLPRISEPVSGSIADILPDKKLREDPPAWRAGEEIRETVNV